MVKRISIFGSTGSVGVSAVSVLLEHPGAFHVVALTAQNNVEKLIEQCHLLHPDHAVIGNEDLYCQLKEGIKGLKTKASAGRQALMDVATVKADCFLSAIVGIAGLEPTYKALTHGTVVALANKESLVASGRIMTQQAQACGATLVPVDSEHSAIFQVFEKENAHHVEKIILTASGGPFYQKSLAELTHVTPQQAVKHPNWSMGAKISVDSATLMNKGLELIEAHHLFQLDESKIDVVIHPQSIIHSMVAYDDGSVLAQMGTPDMKTPIAYGLFWPKRLPTSVARLNLPKLHTLTFFEADEKRFEPLALARESLRTGKTLIFNTANEIAVDAFLKGRIPFLKIVHIVKEALSTYDISSPTSIEEVFSQDADVRQFLKLVV
jgi:1-deoxy-D-xylulose-5-phosphate reductoisomerase